MQIEENSGNNTSILASGSVTSGGKRQPMSNGNYNLNSFNSAVNPNTTASRFYNPQITSESSAVSEPSRFM